MPLRHAPGPHPSPASFLRLGALARLAWVGLPIAAIWIGVAWALSGTS
jgi:hypothetical protein